MTPIEVVLVVLVLSDLFLLGVSRLKAGIRIVALQGLLLGLLAIIAQWGHLTIRVLLIAVCSVVLKTFVFPYLLGRAIKEAGVNREIRPPIGYSLSLACGILMLAGAFWLNARLPLEGLPGNSLVLPIALMTMFTGLFMVISRRSALAQCLGYLVLENGIYTFGMSAVGEIPLLVELGILLDAFVAVLVMGIAIYHINREFDHMDVARLRSLKG